MVGRFSWNDRNAEPRMESKQEYQLSELRAQKRRLPTTTTLASCSHALLSPVALGLELPPGRKPVSRVASQAA
jgi:hypothetical protein